MTLSKIEWTHTTWNPLTGCTKHSPGCINCYAEKMSHRLKSMGSKYYINGFELTLHEELLFEPYKWKKPRIIFVNSMSDLFHEDVPDDFIIKTFNVIGGNPHHTFQILTKRSGRLVEFSGKVNWPENLWMGVSVENDDYVYRIDNLCKTRAKVKFVSFEPLIGSISSCNLLDIDWVIVGGESGPKARPMSQDWVLQLRDKCLNASVPFFFKQWGGVNKKKAGRILDGRTWDQMPALVT